MTSVLNDVAEPVTRLNATDACQWPVIAVFAALPTVGLVQGPSYAGLIFGLAVVQLVVGVCLLRRGFRRMVLGERRMVDRSDGQYGGGLADDRDPRRQPDLSCQPEVDR
jgi:hypothetical protein